MMQTEGEDVYLETPKISYPVIPFLGLLFVLCTRALPNLNPQSTLIGQMEQTNKTEARADVLHLVLRVRLSQVRDDGVEHPMFIWVRQAVFILSVIHVLVGKERSHTVSHVW